MQPYESEIHAIVTQVWLTIVGLEVTRDEGAQVLRTRPDAAVSHVRITGAWRGSVTLYLDARLARWVAALFFNTGPDQVTAAMIADALGELANITGGNFKSCLPDPCDLSLPEQGALSLKPTTRGGSDCGFRSGDMLFLIAIALDPPHLRPA